MDILSPTINQMIFLFAFIVLGFILAKIKKLPKEAATILSKLENMIFIPCLVMGTFIKNFTVSTLSSAWKILLFSLVLEIAIIFITIPICKLCAKDRFTQKIYTYGLGFGNFGFMGNAIVLAIFPLFFTDYIIFTLPLWTLIYVWAVPALLMDTPEEKTSLKSRLKPLINPMFICMIIGMIIGISGLTLPEKIVEVITVSGDCMSPIAMLLTGITLGSISLSGTLKRKSIYVVTVLRLLVYPLVALGIFALLSIWFEIPAVYVVCTVCALAMPLGLNTIVVPAAYGKDTSTAAGMALVSHLASIATIPVIFVLLDMILA
ncbi:MAG: AEC family transporter [Clostridia bacterium]|nr:AEC family transporter [Clostridia bacterium]